MFLDTVPIRHKIVKNKNRTYLTGITSRLIDSDALRQWFCRRQRHRIRLSGNKISVGVKVGGVRDSALTESIICHVKRDQTQYVPNPTV